MSTAQRRAALAMAGWATGTVHQERPGLTGSTAWRSFAADWERLAPNVCVELSRDAHPVLQDLVGVWAAAFDLVGRGARCRVSRTTARPGAPGWPLAAAGADPPDQPGRPACTVILLVSRCGVVGGIDVVRGPDGDVSRALLTRPGQYLVLNARQVAHRVGPIALAGPATRSIAHRDVLVVDFVAP